MSVLIVTSLGDIVIDLHSTKCPLTCKNFLKLCKKTIERAHMPKNLWERVKMPRDYENKDPKMTQMRIHTINIDNDCTYKGYQERVKKRGKGCELLDKVTPST